MHTLIYEQVLSGGDRNYSYIAGCEKTKQGVVIDPSPDPLPVYNRIKELGLNTLFIINTHAHSDHTGGNAFFVKETGAVVIVHEWTSAGNSDWGKIRKVKDGETLNVGDIVLTFIHTPGHTKESMCIQIENELVTGDTLFVGKVGGTYSGENTSKEFESLKKLMKFNPEIRIWPGHNYGDRPSSTIGEELKTNPFILRLDNFENFMWLKDNWASYKLEHGIA